MKRWYGHAEVVAKAGGWSVTLDSKPILTPARAPLVVPTQALATAIAAEWDAQAPDITPATMRLTSLANAAIDRVASDPTAFAGALAAYAEGDTLLYRAAEPPALVTRQTTVWEPIVRWAEQRLDTVFTRVTGQMHRAQPAAALARIGNVYRALDTFELAALHPVVTVTGSALLGLALAYGELDAQAVWAAGQLDELWQAEQYAPEPAAEASRANSRAALESGARLLDLIGVR